MYANVYVCGRMNVHVCVGPTLVRVYMCVCARVWALVGVRARVMLRMCLCMHVRLQVRAGVHAGMRACAYINRMYAYYYAAQYVRGLRVCVRVCAYASIPTYMCTCVRAHV